MEIEKEIKEATKERKLVVGARMVIKGIKKAGIKYVICPENCREDVMEELAYYGKSFGIEIKKFSGNSRQLGEICGKPFNIMLLGVKK
jgi:large subunit ribosomal protein L30e